MPASAHAVNCGINANAFTVKRAPASNSNLALRSRDITTADNQTVAIA